MDDKLLTGLDKFKTLADFIRDGYEEYVPLALLSNITLHVYNEVIKNVVYETITRQYRKRGEDYGKVIVEKTAGGTTSYFRPYESFEQEYYDALDMMEELLIDKVINEILSVDETFYQLFSIVNNIVGKKLEHDPLWHGNNKFFISLYSALIIMRMKGYGYEKIVESIKSSDFVLNDKFYSLGLMVHLLRTKEVLEVVDREEIERVFQNKGRKEGMWRRIRKKFLKMKNRVLWGISKRKTVEGHWVRVS